jgi:hypothetical protein
MLNSLSLTFGETSGITDASTDADIATGTDIATEYYNLQGIRITTPTGIHIVKRGNTATLRRQP